MNSVKIGICFVAKSTEIARHLIYNRFDFLKKNHLYFHSMHIVVCIVELHQSQIKWIDDFAMHIIFLSISFEIA